jgi:hypothetical protein
MKNSEGENSGVIDWFGKKKKELVGLAVVASLDAGVSTNGHSGDTVAPAERVVVSAKKDGTLEVPKTRLHSDPEFEHKSLNEKRSYIEQYNQELESDLQAMHDVLGIDPELYDAFAANSDFAVLATEEKNTFDVVPKDDKGNPVHFNGSELTKEQDGTYTLKVWSRESANNEDAQRYPGAEYDVARKINMGLSDVAHELEKFSALKERLSAYAAGEMTARDFRDFLKENNISEHEIKLIISKELDGKKVRVKVPLFTMP